MRRGGDPGARVGARAGAGSRAPSLADCLTVCRHCCDTRQQDALQRGTYFRRELEDDCALIVPADRPNANFSFGV